MVEMRRHIHYAYRLAHVVSCKTEFEHVLSIVIPGQVYVRSPCPSAVSPQTIHLFQHLSKK